MTAVKTLIVCLVLILAVADATQLLRRSPRHGLRIHRKLYQVQKEEKNANLPKPIPHIFPAPQLPPSAKAAYSFAVDLTVGGSVSTFNCIYKAGYDAVFIQAYSPANGGSLNGNLVTNLNNAAAAGLGNEIFVTPVSTKTGQSQFDAVYNYLKSSGINIRTVWLQVTNAVNWSSNIPTNVNLITNFASRANANGISVGIYTNWQDWQQIAGSSTTFSSLRLWYWSVRGNGPNGESPANFNDFSSFGGWTSPAVKQFAINESLCGLTLNRDIYPGGSKAAAAKAEKKSNVVDGKLTVGGFV